MWFCQLILIMKRYIYVIKCKDQNMPNFPEFLKLVDYYIKLEQLAITTLYQQRNFNKKWNLYLTRNQGFMAHLIVSVSILYTFEADSLYIWGRFSIHLRPILYTFEADSLYIWGWSEPIRQLYIWGRICLIGSDTSHDKINYLCLKCMESNV